MKNTRLDGLRGLGSLNVALTHFLGAFLPFSHFIGLIIPSIEDNKPTIIDNDKFNILINIAITPFVSFFYSGLFAVTIFFILSGFVLSMPYADGNKKQLQDRLIGRYLRLNIPIALACAASYLIAELGLYYIKQATEVSKSTLWSANFAQNISGSDFLEIITYKTILLGDISLNPQLWTMKFEFLGSIFLLIFYIVISKRFLIPAIVILFIALVLIYAHASIFYIAIFLGSILNFISVPKKINIPLILFGIFLGATQMEGVIFHLLPAIRFNGIEIWQKKEFYCTAGAFMVTLAVINGFGINFLQNRVCQFLGKISYPLYLLHYLVLGSLTCYLYVFFPKNNYLLALNFLIFILISIGFSMLFEKYVDKPAIKVSHLISRMFRLTGD